jgi:hypothetical protein
MPGAASGVGSMTTPESPPRSTLKTPVHPPSAITNAMQEPRFIAAFVSGVAVP